MKSKIAIVIVISVMFFGGCAVYAPYGGYGYAAPVVPVPVFGFRGFHR